MQLARWRIARQRPLVTDDHEEQPGFTLFVIAVVYWLLYANKPGHGMPQSAREQEEGVIESAG